MRMDVWLILVFFLFFQACVQNNYLDQDYATFDQSPNSVWRRLAQEGRFKDAARLVDRYLKRKKDLDVSQVVNLNFHAGQLYAFAGRAKIARERFGKAKYDPIPEVDQVQMKAFFQRWNIYVDSTIAFIEKNKQKLLDCRTLMAKISNVGVETSNLDIVDCLIEYFEKPYSEAYRAQKSKSKEN